MFSFSRIAGALLAIVVTVLLVNGVSDIPWFMIAWGRYSANYAAKSCPEVLKNRARCLPQTFNYEDFTQENLAVSRGRGSPLQALVFDYDCFTLGMAYSDIRNVMYSLERKARQAFIEAYGPTSEAERLLDIPLSSIYGLLVASGRESVPGWARSLLDDVKSGRLESAIHDSLG